jgi:hypothetical protein
VYRVLVANHDGRNHWEDRGVNVRTETRCILGKWLWGCGADRDRWRAVVSAVTNPRVLAPRS